VVHFQGDGLRLSGPGRAQQTGCECGVFDEVFHGLSPVMERGLGHFASMKVSWFFCDGDLRLFVISILNNSSPPVQMLTNGATHSAGAVDVAGT
jgi:hypothetical protein